ncbi:metalloregulator ArsR/SmtB family transcription factor [bacterium]|nr:metalloregulator ArsR/SmtB family transcription factor [bacterium]
MSNNMNRYDEKKWIEHAEMLKAMAHPKRLAILEELCDGAKCVQDVQQAINISQPNLSRHLSALKNVGLINFHINGPLRCYYLAKPSLVKKLLGEMLKDHPQKIVPFEKAVREAQKYKQNLELKGA